jgi:hypothetical protein
MGLTKRKIIMLFQLGECFKKKEVLLQQTVNLFTVTVDRRPKNTLQLTRSALKATRCNMWLSLR